MKILNILSAILTIIVVGSGAALMYLYYVDYATNDNPLIPNTPTPTSVIETGTGTDLQNECIDFDNDGYGQGCESGIDCDDNDAIKNETCESMGQIKLSTDISDMNVGDEFIVDVVVDALSEDVETKAIKLKIDYDNEILDFVSFDLDEGSYMAIPVKATDGTYEIHVTKNSSNEPIFKNGEKILTLRFVANAAGNTIVKVNPQTLFVDLDTKYNIESTSSVDITILENGEDTTDALLNLDFGEEILDINFEKDLEF